MPIPSINTEPQPVSSAFINAGMIRAENLHVPSNHLVGDSMVVGRLADTSVTEVPLQGMTRYNKGKLPMGLAPTSFTRQFIFKDLPYDLHTATVKVLDFGAQKYAAHNWRKSGSWVSVYNSLMRHVLLGLKNGEVKDPESGLDHWGHIGCNLAFLLEFARENSGVDDRYTVSSPNSIRADFKDIELNSLDNFILIMLEWLDGGPTERLEKAIAVGANVYHNEKREV